jgi:DGQHR domain-containing protein
METKRRNVIRRRALRVEQDPAHPLYLFTLTGDELLAIADISRISRNDAGNLIGYQRPEVKRHVQDIVEYLDGDNVLFPNSLILALSSGVRFRSSRGPGARDGLSTSGVLEIPLPRSPQAKPAWIVDGQQRAIALSKSKRRGFPIAVNAFVADEVDLQRDQFLRVNNAKPLPRGLITELLPEVSSPLPPKLAAKKIPSAICDWLSRSAVSPFFGLIRRASTPKTEKTLTVVTDTPVVKMLPAAGRNTYRLSVRRGRPGQSIGSHAEERQRTKAETRQTAGESGADCTATNPEAANRANSDPWPHSKADPQAVACGRSGPGRTDWRFAACRAVDFARRRVRAIAAPPRFCTQGNRDVHFALLPCFLFS